MMLRRQDLDRLSWIAETGERGIEPLVLKVQAELFASARNHQPAAIRDFEALALALLPRVDEDTAAYVANCLTALPATPASILAALEGRIGDASGSARVEATRPPPPALDGLPLQALVDRARLDAVLAHQLLADSDLPALEAARLYIHADRAKRDDIRRVLAGAGMAGRRPMRLQRPSQEAVAGLLDAADHHDTAAFGARLADCMGLPSIPEWRFQRVERHDILALAVSAIGLCEEDAIRIFLTLIPDVAQSVETVFGLVDIFRRTPRSVSVMILEAALDLHVMPRGGAQIAPQHGQDLADRTGRGGTMPEMHERGRQLRPRLPDRAG